MFVHVVNKDGRLLMLTHPRKARLLLNAGKIKVIRRIPFTIQLLFGSFGDTQLAYVGRDPGKTSSAEAVCGDGQDSAPDNIPVRLSWVASDVY
ncbi:RRXRR domain-containing protein [Sulfobacillus thermosulfidooxidans]|uniref:RRXRR domain-containing protein n=1 Tax=Sulfobacillus thermosulfidooxidans TaxID=28034 RepID=UPI0006B544CD|nr:RRXRR domain-containing protein [Sulfobacillus thermosulfidooxidans]